MTDSAFEKLVLRALETLPDDFQEYLDNVVISVEDEPPEDMPDVMGLYEGIPLTERTSSDFLLPDRVIIYKGPILRACRNDAQIAEEVRLTVLHEIGHFFGLDEDSLM